MAGFHKILSLSLLAFACFFTKVTCNEWLDDTTKLLTREARGLIDGGNQVMKSLQAKVNDRKTLLEENPPVSGKDGIDWIACANFTQSITNGESLAVAGATLYFDISNDFSQITSCLSSDSKSSCWQLIVRKLPNFLEKYKPLTTCYVNNVYYTIEVIDFYFNECLGSSTIVPPEAPPKTFDLCIKNI